MGKEIVSGVGARYGGVANLDIDGLPSVNVSSAVPVQGSLFQGIKSLAVNDPDPQRFTHYGDDTPYAQDSLPATEVGSFTITTSKSNMIIDTMLEGTKIRTVDGINWRAGNTDKKGQEPQVVSWFYRQALDTKKGSATFGKLRQWHVMVYPTARITPNTQSMEQGATDKTYDATPSPSSYTPWNEPVNETNWGANQGEYLEAFTDYQPRFNWWLGNGTITAFQLSHPPVSASYLHVWVDGTLTTPTTVNTSITNPAFTLGSAPATLKKVLALIETNVPGNT